MASQTHVPNSHRKYDLDTDGITITAHTPPRRLGADAREVTNWTRNGGRSKDDPFVIVDDGDVQEIHETSSICLSRSETSCQTATNPDMTVSRTLAFLSMVRLIYHSRIQFSALRGSKPRIQIPKLGATLVPARQRSLVHAIVVPNPYHTPLLKALGLHLRLYPPSPAKQAKRRMGPFSQTIRTTHRAFPARGKAQNDQI